MITKNHTRKLVMTITLVLLVLPSALQSQVRGSANEEGIFAEFATNKGRILVRLRYDKAPMTVANFIGLATGTIKNASFPAGKSFYEGSVWHRVVKGHVIQGGSPVTDRKPENEDSSVTGYEIPNEISDLSHNKPGMLGMANSGPHTNTCQYYITLGDRSYLDGNYTLFGEVVEGMDVVNRIIQGDTTYSIRIIRKGSKAKSFRVNNETFRKLVDNQWKKVKEEEALKKNKDEKFIRDNYGELMDTDGGLHYRILQQGSGDIPLNGSELIAWYKGTLTNGIVFASSATGGRPVKGDDPSAFTYIKGKSQLIKGLTETLDKMKVGERRLVIIPPELAYGNTGFYAAEVPGQKRFVISPGESLILEITLKEIK